MRVECTLFYTQKGEWQVKLPEVQGRTTVGHALVPARFKDEQRTTGAYRFEAAAIMEGDTITKVVDRSVVPEPPLQAPAVQQGEPHKMFRNPYNFVPIVDRQRLSGPLGDAEPVGHARYHDDRYAGRIRVTAEVTTPLLIPPAEPTQQQGDHPIYGCRELAPGMPWLPPSSLRGALRARYEAITASRFGIRSEALDDRLAFRLGTDDAQRAVPAIVWGEGDDAEVVPLTGTNTIPRNPGQPLWAAWLPIGGSEPDELDHGTFVKARLRRYQHVRPNGQADYPVWVVERAVPVGAGELAPGAWELHQRSRAKASLDRYRDENQVRVVYGWVFRTSPSPDQPSNDRRKFERLFFTDVAGAGGHPSEQQVIDHARRRATAFVSPFAGRLAAGWEGVIKGYDAAEDVRMQGPQANQPGSAHLSPDATVHREGRHGLLCYAVLTTGQNAISHLSPVTIGREPYERSPAELLPDSVDVARRWDGLSPADRVFGWVHPDAAAADDRRVALRSSVRITPPVFDPPADGEPGLVEDVSRTLAILSGPKPAYARFYVADGDGAPAGNGHKREVGYRDGHRLRGRKVYPHQPAAEQPDWFTPGKSRAWESNDPTNQNRTFERAVRQGARFSFDVVVRNLDAVELGALLEVIALSSGDGRLRLGYGRPLGFGSVQLTLDEVRVETGEDRRARLDRFDTSAPPTLEAEEVAKLRGSFTAAFAEAFKEPFEQHRIGRAVAAEARGFDDEVEVTYPRTRKPDDPTYTWFVNNERDPHGKKAALPLLDLDQPYANRR